MRCIQSCARAQNPPARRHSSAGARALRAAALLLAAAGAGSAADYSDEIRPILSDRCYACHGPDGNQRQAGLRLDREDGARAELPSISLRRVSRLGSVAAWRMFIGSYRNDT